jgi:hypothetical protein
MATFTSTVYVNQAVKQVHKGTQTVSGQWTGTAAVTADDVVFLAKLPHGAIISEFMVDHSAGVTTYAIDYGLASGAKGGGGASLSCFVSALATATIIRKNIQNAAGVDRIQVSCSVSDPGRFGIFAAKIGVAGSATFIPVINFRITYRCDEGQGL